ncbi:4-oxalocrotonate tautomerase [Acuticoccus sp. M5D2P5]|uniref:4-oxalocrotonate tautomerase n=1 Tax=Acuticoccus kalidii TaxID=2910977 RepID=UPI001F1F1FA1|nr:4-oxalocrotonate tautomerase [Acuticoccus kalidii]MCF3933452.1 4-oxalocrotonate tautomerase [Acuticoccus kalidii]
MPIIRVELLEGRTTEQKRALVKEVTEAFVRTCGGNAASLQVVIHDVQTENWGSGGELIADKKKA